VKLNGIIPGPNHTGFAAILTEEQAQTYANGTSDLNFTPGSVDPNGTEVKLDASEKVCVVNSQHGPVDAVLDVKGIIPADTEYAQRFESTVQRVLDTRSGLGMKTPAAMIAAGRYACADLGSLGWD